MAFSTAMPEAFRLALFNDSPDNDNLQDFASTHVTQQTATQVVLQVIVQAYSSYKYTWLLYFIIVTTAIEKCDTKSFWYGFTESHFKIIKF